MGFDLRGETREQGSKDTGHRFTWLYGICGLDFDEDQARKSARGMPWHQEPMKDVISCDKLRGAANELRSGDFRMGKPTFKVSYTESIGV